jgi:hypothetical protein
MYVILGYLHCMSRIGRTAFRRRIQTAMAATTLAIALTAPSAGASEAASKPSKTHSLYQSRELWATIDVCGPKDQASTIGIRGSMPSDGHEKDAMYMRFIVQSLDTATKQWADLGKNADSGFVAVGTAKSIRQAGRSFELVPASGSPPATLRGVVDFQWRRGKTIVGATSRITSAEHKSLAGADPEGYSAATCSLA